MTNPATCRPAITPYIVISLARSWAVIAANDCHSSCLVRGDLDALGAAPQPGMLSGRALIQSPVWRYSWRSPISSDASVAGIAPGRLWPGGLAVLASTV